MKLKSQQFKDLVDFKTYHIMYDTKQYPGVVSV